MTALGALRSARALCALRVRSALCACALRPARALCACALRSALCALRTALSAARVHIYHDTGAPLTTLRTSSTRWSGFFGTPIVRQAPSSQLGDEMVRMYSYRHREGPGQS